jgi:hypothetical protein
MRVRFGHRKLVGVIVAGALLCASAGAAAMTFADDFDDGRLGGWVPKQGAWSNPGSVLRSSWDNYGVAWRAGTFGLDQRLEVDAFFDGATGGQSKTALLGLRGGAAGNINPYFDHAYWAYVRQGEVSIVSTYKPYDLVTLARRFDVDLPRNAWTSIALQVSGSGRDTRLQLWVDDGLMLDVFDHSGRAHDDGGYVALGASNHLNRYIDYDNARGWSQPLPGVPEAATWSMLALGLGALALRARRSRCAAPRDARRPG